MARPTKLTKELQQKIGKSVALGLPYALAAAAVGITYQTFNDWMNKGKNSTSGEYFEFYKYIQKCNADAAMKCLERLKGAVDSGNVQVAMWILERRFPESYGKRDYRKINAENKNENINIIIKDEDEVRQQILAKFDRVEESNDYLTN